MSDLTDKEIILQLKARIQELETSMELLANTARNVIKYWRKKYETKRISE